MLPNRVPRDLNDVINMLERRVGKLERRPTKGFTIGDIAGSGAETFAQDTAPTTRSGGGSLVAGDLWVNTGENNALYRWDGGQWVSVLDPIVDQVRDNASIALANAQEPGDSADTEIVTWVQSAPPSGALTGDMWIDTDDHQLFEWNGSVWVAKGDTTVGDAVIREQNASSYADNRIYTWWQFQEPTPQGIGDLWIDTSGTTSVLYRWDNFDWVPVLDWSLIDLAQQVQTKVTTFSQANVPIANAAGDIWYDTSDNNRPYRATVRGAHTIGVDGWVSVRDDAAGTSIDQQPDEPGAPKVGDIWINSYNRMYRWDGAHWVPVLSDGQAPSASPIPALAGGIGVIYATWQGISNSSLVTYRVHVSTASNMPLDSSTFIASTTATTVTIKKLPNGDPLQYNTDYYVAVLATDVDGNASTPGISPQPGRLVPAGQTDISAEYAYLGRVKADQIDSAVMSATLGLTGSLKVGARATSPNGKGAGLDLSSAGLEVHMADDSITTTINSDGTAKFVGDAEFNEVTVTDGGLTMRSKYNELSRGGKVTIQQGVTSSNASPTLTTDWATTAIQNILGADKRSLQRLGTRWLVGSSTTTVNAQGQTIITNYADEVNTDGSPYVGGIHKTFTNGTLTFYGAVALSNDNALAKLYSGTSNTYTLTVDAHSATYNFGITQIATTIGTGGNTGTVSVTVSTPPSPPYPLAGDTVTVAGATTGNGTFSVTAAPVSGSGTKVFTLYGWSGGTSAIANSGGSMTWTYNVPAYSVSIPSLSANTRPVITVPTGNTNRLMIAERAAGPATRTNLSTNPSLETNTTGWNSTGSGETAPTIARSTTRSHGGSASLLVTSQGDDAAGFPPSVGSPTFSVTTGVTYTASAYVYIPTGSNHLQLVIPGEGLAGFSQSSNVNDQWQRLSVTWTSTQTTAAQRVQFWIGGGTFTTGKTLYIDDLLIEQAISVGDYFDGSTANGIWTYAWTSTAHLSTSTATTVSGSQNVAVRSFDPFAQAGVDEAAHDEDPALWTANNNDIYATAIEKTVATPMTRRNLIRNPVPVGVSHYGATNSNLAGVTSSRSIATVNWATSGVSTVNLTGTLGLQPGDMVTITGNSTGGGLNGTYEAVSVAPDLTWFTIRKTRATSGSTGENGTATFKAVANHVESATLSDNITPVVRAYVPGVSPVLTRYNLVTNPSFETNTVGWTSLDAVLSRTSGMAGSYGTYALAIAPSTTSDCTVSYTVNGLTPGVSYRFGAKVNGSSSTLDGITVSINGSYSNTVPYSGGWIDVYYVFTPAAGQTSYTFNVTFSSSASSWTAYLDQAYCEKSATYISYFDGTGSINPAGQTFAWQGTAHASVSIATSPANKVNQQEGHGYLKLTQAGETLTPGGPHVFSCNARVSGRGTVTGSTDVLRDVKLGIMGPNLVLNPSFETFTGSVPDNWAVVEGTAGTTYVVTGSAVEGARLFSFYSNNGNVAYGSRAMAVTPGQKYLIRCWVQHTNGTGTYYVRMNYQTSAPASGYVTITTRTGYTEFKSAVASSTIFNWTPFVFEWTAPAGVTYASLSFYNWGSSTGALNVDSVEMVPYLYEGLPYTISYMGAEKNLSWAITVKSGTLPLDDVRLLPATATSPSMNCTVDFWKFRLEKLSTVLAHESFSNQTGDRGVFGTSFGTVAWGGGNGPYDGGYLTATSTTTNQNIGIGVTDATPLPVSPGDSIHARALFVAGNTAAQGRTIVAQIMFRDAANTTTVSTTQSLQTLPASLTTWVPVETSAIAPANAASVIVRFFAQTTVASVTVGIDVATVSKGPIPQSGILGLEQGGYFDGNTTDSSLGNATWEGTVNDSVSNMTGHLPAGYGSPSGGTALQIYSTTDVGNVTVNPTATYNVNVNSDYSTANDLTGDTAYRVSLRATWADNWIYGLTPTWSHNATVTINWYNGLSFLGSSAISISPNTANWRYLNGTLGSTTDTTFTFYTRSATNANNAYVVISFTDDNDPTGTLEDSHLALIVDDLQFRRAEGAWNEVSGTRVISTASPSVDTSFALNGLYYGAADFGTTEYAFSYTDSTGTWVRTMSTAGALIANQEFRQPAGTSGIAWDGTSFWTLAGTALYKHESANNWAGPYGDPLLGVWYAGFTWRAVSPRTAAETNLSAISSINMDRRARLIVTTPPINDTGDPGDPNAIGVYLGRATTAGVVPAYDKMYTQGTSSTNRIAVAAAVFSGTTAPNPTTNPGFTTSTPAQIVAATGGFQVTGDSKGAWPFMIPPGTLSMFAGAALPTSCGWLICDGSAFDSRVYPALAATLGDTHGTHGSGIYGVYTYYLPNLKGRAPVGLDTTQTEFNTLGKTGGEKTVILDATEIPAHAHPIGGSTGNQSAVHQHPQVVTANTGGTGVRRDWYADGSGLGRYAQGVSTDGETTNHTHTLPASTQNNTGGGGDHNNLQPYAVVNYIIKY